MRYGSNLCKSTGEFLLRNQQRKVKIDIYFFKWKDGNSISERVTELDLTHKSTENVEYMIEQIMEKLKVLNIGAIKPSHFDEEMYEELKEIYEMVQKKNSFSPSEMQALVEELGNLRKR